MLKWWSVHCYFTLGEFLIRSLSECGALIELLIEPAFLGRNGSHFFVGHSLAHTVISFLSVLVLSDEVTSDLADLYPGSLVDHLVKRILIIMGLIASESSLFVDTFQFVLKRIVLSIRRHLEVKLILIPLLITALKIWIDLFVWLADETYQFVLLKF